MTENKQINTPESRKYRDLVEKHNRILKSLEEKEAFNSALFQFHPYNTVVVDKNGRVIKYNSAKYQSGDRLPEMGDIMYRDYASKHSKDMHGILMECIRNNKSVHLQELKYNDKYLSITISPMPDGAIIVSRDITQEKKREIERLDLIKDLQRALNEIEKLHELLPICSMCKRIRDDKGYWKNVEEYFHKRDNLDFSHTVCPECAKETYPDIWKSLQKNSRDQNKCEIGNTL